MKKNYLSGIKLRLDALERDSIHEDSIRQLFPLFAQHLESNNLKETYKVLNFYCCLLKHDNITNIYAIEILNNLSTVLKDPKDRNFNDNINKLLSLKELRANIRGVLKSENIHSELFDTFQLWKTLICNIIMMDLVKLEKSVRLKSNPHSDMYCSELSFYNPDPSKMDQDYINAFSITKEDVFWRAVIMPKNYILTGPVVMTEKSAEFD